MRTEDLCMSILIVSLSGRENGRTVLKCVVNFQTCIFTIFTIFVTPQWEGIELQYDVDAEHWS